MGTSPLPKNGNMTSRTVQQHGFPQLRVRDWHDQFVSAFSGLP
jgi:hypothetical protein